MRNKTITQIILVVVSVVIITTYIQPTFEDMEEIRTEASEYQVALENAASYNAALQELYTRANAFSVSERRALERYLPKEIDTIAVMRDIETIIENQSMSLVSLASTESESSVQDSGAISVQGQEMETRLPVMTQQFTVGVTGTYKQFKSLLQGFERNAYPLEVAAIDFVTPEDGSYEFNVTLETYSLVTETE